MPVAMTCKKCGNKYSLSRNLYDLKVSRENFVNYVQNNIITWSFKEPFADVVRYLNLALTCAEVQCSYVFSDWLSPKHGLIFFVEAERSMGRKQFCKKCAYDYAASILMQVVDGTKTDYVEVNFEKKPVGGLDKLFGV